MYVQQVKQKKHQQKTIRKQPMQINPRRRNKNRMIVVRVDQRKKYKKKVVDTVPVEEELVYILLNYL
jgi:hypothetical protein